MEVLQFITFWIGASWDFFTEVKVPGFDFSIGALFIGIFLATLGLRFVLSMLGVSVWSGSFWWTDRFRNKSEKKRGE